MKIAIAGFGAEGRSNYQYWQQPGSDLIIYDERSEIDDLPPGASAVLGQSTPWQLNGFDMIIRTAGLAPSKIKTDGKVWSATNEFFARCPAPIIGVTGSKGKGTTCSLIASILREAGRTVHLVGNIGVPALGVLSKIAENDIVVYELSSFQLWDIQRSPHVAVMLMIEPDHLKVHVGMDDYVGAKANILAFQGKNDIGFYHPTNQYVRQIVEKTQGHGHLLPYNQIGSTDNLVSIVWADKGYFYASKENLVQKICSTDKLRLVGEHNIENATAAISAAMVYTNDLQAIGRGVSNFTGLPHRLKFVRELAGVKYYDDSIATTPGSVLAAMRAIKQPKILIIGGLDKGANYEELASEIAGDSNVSKVITIGSNGSSIAELIKLRGYKNVRSLGLDSMTNIVNEAHNSTQPGDAVILSPAAASFDMFKSYVDRGNQFIAAVNRL